jgi:hypothetical protein
LYVWEVGCSIQPPATGGEGVFMFDREKAWQELSTMGADVAPVFAALAASPDMLSVERVGEFLAKHAPGTSDRVSVEHVLALGGASALLTESVDNEGESEDLPFREWSVYGLDDEQRWAICADGARAWWLARREGGLPPARPADPWK